MKSSKPLPAADAAEQPLKVLFVSPEVVPFSKSGGLGDVAGSLPKELQKLGVEVRVFTPLYKSMQSHCETADFVGSFDVKLGWRRQSASVYRLDSGVCTYAVQNNYYFERDGFYGYGDDYERFAFFCKAAVELCRLVDFHPDIIHCNDWQSALVPLYLKDFFSSYLFYKDIKVLFTIHNLQYQGVFGMSALGGADLNSGYASIDKLEFCGGISYMKAGLLYSDAINTVSKTYADEIQTQSYGYGLEGLLRSLNERLSGIANGIDYDVYDPKKDDTIYYKLKTSAAKYKAENKAALQKEFGLPLSPDTPIFAVITRLVDQKGLDIISQSVDELMSRDVQLFILGTGDGKYEHMFRHLQQRYSDKLSVNIMFDETMAHKIYAGADFFLMPSLFEPCGLGQIIAMRYGTSPIVRKTGGLADTVTHFADGQGNGFLFEDYLQSGLMWAINAATEVYRDKTQMEQLVKNCLQTNLSWNSSAKEYINLYNSMIQS